MSADQDIADLKAWFAANTSLSPSGCAEYAQRIRAYTNPNPQASLPLRAAEENQK